MIDTFPEWAATLFAIYVIWALALSELFHWAVFRRDQSVPDHRIDEAIRKNAARWRPGMEKPDGRYRPCNEAIRIRRSGGQG